MNNSASTVEDRVRQQFPALFITLVTVLIGLVLGDVVTEARARMALWPLTLGTLRTWGQLFGIVTSALAAWMAYAHIGISRFRTPSLADSFVTFLIPMPLFVLTTFSGTKDIWPWFYWASAYVIVCIVTSLWLYRITSEEADLAPFSHVYRPTGFMAVFYLAMPAFAAAGWADQHKLLSPLLETCIALATPLGPLVVMHVFMRDWRRAIAATTTHRQEDDARLPIMSAVN